jgi:uncharacterized membrane protein YeaQ/YmgE (transglycosylase-associated protein family)
METLVWILAGAALGWASYSYLGFNEARGMMVSMIIGAVGALVGAKALAPIFMATAAPTAGFSTAVLFFAAGAAAACLALANMLHRRWGV